MTIAVKILAAVLAVAVAGCAGFMLGHQGRGDAYQQRRLGMIRMIVNQAGPGQMLLVGDSIVEMQPLPPLCGLTAINAGIAGARSTDLIGFATTAIAVARPSRMVFAVGVNDLVQGTDLAAWTARTTELVGLWPGKPVIVGITSVKGEDDAVAQRMNAILHRLATARGGVFVTGLTLQETFDGVHPSLAGTKAWQARITTACGGA
ncbi:SGNH/GDSL hydrolase family protein [Sphingomonas sp. ERG5]|uniref:SGNH/GDSL hydrolase family protein n=1 Tax=Sphingomonas sp. ERG5 TaxID=1381597 RepID=UPI00054B1204|nr:GDSL-type esterase/lipase family protein [Sphingomonas sp. ERG5]